MQDRVRQSRAATRQLLPLVAPSAAAKVAAEALGVKAHLSAAAKVAAEVLGVKAHPLVEVKTAAVKPDVNKKEGRALRPVPLFYSIFITTNTTNTTIYLAQYTFHKGLLG